MACGKYDEDGDAKDNDKDDGEDNDDKDDKNNSDPHLSHHLTEVLGLHLALGMLHEEGVESLLDLDLVQPGGLGEGDHVLVPEDGHAVLVAHDESRRSCERGVVVVAGD